MQVSDYLSKAEAFTILELVGSSISSEGEQDFNRLMNGMHTLLPYDAALCAHAKQGSKREIVYDIMCIRYPGGELPICAVDRWMRTGPSPKKQSDTVLMRRWNDMLDHVVPRIDPLATSSGSGSEKSYIRTVWDAAGKGVSFFSLSGKRINSSGRTAAIMDLMTPHLHKALARVVCGDKSEATSCSVLSPREKAVIDWLRKGKSNPDIAAIMDISERTVKFHISNIMQKLDASSRTHAVAIAIEQGLLDSR